MPLTCLFLTAVTAVLEVAILAEWYLRWRGLRKAFPLADKKAQALVCLRVSLFTVYTWLALAASLLLREESSPGIPYLFEAGLPLATFLVVATQEDILEAWGLRKAAPVYSPTSPDEHAPRVSLDDASSSLNLRDSWV